jgi:hypothetical protein
MFGKNRPLLKATLGSRLGLIIAIPFATLFNILAYFSPPTDLTQTGSRIIFLVLLFLGTGLLAGITLMIRPPVLFQVTQRGIWIHPHAQTKKASHALMPWPAISGVSLSQPSAGDNPMLLIHIDQNGWKIPGELPIHQDSEGTAVCLRVPARPRQQILMSQLKTLQQRYGSTSKIEPAGASNCTTDSLSRP